MPAWNVGPGPALDAIFLPFFAAAYLCVPCYWGMDIRERKVVDVWPAQSLSFISISCPLHRKMSEWQWNGASSSSTTSFLPPISLQGERRRGGTTKIFFQRHVSSWFLFLPRKHTKQQPKRVEMGFPCRLTRRYTVCQLGVPRVYSAHSSNREISRKKNMAEGWPAQRIVLLGTSKAFAPDF